MEINQLLTRNRNEKLISYLQEKLKEVFNKMKEFREQQNESKYEKQLRRGQ